MYQHLNKKIALAIILLHICAGSSFSQNTFQRTYNFGSASFLREIIPAAGNKYLVCGSVVSAGLYIMKTDSVGQPIWNKMINNPKENFSYTFQSCSDGGVIMSGQVKDPYNNWDIFLTRTDSTGNVLWSRAYGGNQSDFGYFAKQTSDGGFIAGGVLAHGGQQVRQFIFKTDANGIVQWSQSFTDTATLSISMAYDAVELNNGYIICGTLRNLSNPPVDNDGTLIRIDLNGNLQWGYSFGFTEWDQFNRVIPLNDGGFLAGGFTDTNSNSGNIREILLCKFDSLGNYVWGKTYGAAGDDLAWDFNLTSSNGVVITGRTTSFNFGSPDYYMIVTDSVGNMLWSRSYGGGGEENLNTGLQTPDGGLMAGGSTISFGSFSDNSYLVKTNSVGYSSCNELLSPATQTANISLPLVNSLFLQIAGLDTNYAVACTVTSSIPSTNLLCTSTAINKINNDYFFSISPNLVTDDLTINFSKNNFSHSLIRVYNSLGELISAKQKLADDSQIKFNSKSWAVGVYYVTVTSDHFQLKTAKVVKR